MYQVSCHIVGVAPLMQHRFPVPELSLMGKGGKKNTGAIDYTQEWRDYLYVNARGEIYQPSCHIEGAGTHL